MSMEDATSSTAAAPAPASGASTTSSASLAAAAASGAQAEAAADTLESRFGTLAVSPKAMLAPRRGSFAATALVVPPATSGVTSPNGSTSDERLRTSRQCSSPFDWSDTLQRSDKSNSTMATPPRSPYDIFETTMSPPLSPRAHRAWSTSAVPDRKATLPATLGLLPSVLPAPMTPGSAGSHSGSVSASMSYYALASQNSSGVGTPLHPADAAALGYVGNGHPLAMGPPPATLAMAANGGAGFDEKSLSLRVDIDKVLSGEEQRTTVMVRNIPNKYTAAQLRAELDAVCPGGYDYLYLPMDFSSHCNVGYAFVNFCTRDGLVRFYRHQDGKRWELHHSDKVCELRFARIQGREALILEHQKQFAKHGHRKSRPVVATRPVQAGLGM